MKKIFFLLFISNTLFGQTKATKIQVLILGSYHTAQFENGSDILTKKKQEEISSIVNQLSIYNPDKIFVEINPENQTEWDVILANYQKGISPKDTFNLAMETFQIGVKLAKKLNLKQVFSVNYDWPNSQDSSYIPKSKIEAAYINYIREIYIVGRTVPDKDWLSEMMLKTEDEMKEIYKNIPKSTLQATLKLLNSPDIRRKQTYTAMFANMDNDPRGIGAELTNIQQLRNMKIFQNIINKVDKDTRRIIVIYGASHAEPLRDFFEMNPRFEIVELDKYLK
jgi:Family of unknown function (DUF5694)